MRIWCARGSDEDVHTVGLAVCSPLLFMMKQFLSLKGGVCVLELISRLSTCHSILMHSCAYTGTLREDLMSVPKSQGWQCGNWRGTYWRMLKGLLQSNGHFFFWFPMYNNRMLLSCWCYLDNK